jgi:imidazolonepropionase-like amidohydrolase
LYVARLLALPNVTGTVTAGSVGDLILLDANPLDDVRNVRRPAGVLLRGTWYDRTMLEQRLLSLDAARP